MGVEPPDQHNSFGGGSGRGMITRMILVLAVFITAHFAFAQEEHAATALRFRPSAGRPSRALNLYQDSSGSGHALNTVGGCPASDPRGGRHRPCLSGCPVSRALFGAGDSQHRLNIDLVNMFAAWTDAISSVKRPALGIERTVRSFGTLEALRSFSYLSCHSKVISLTFYDQRVPSWSELKLGVLRTQQ
jgi:hypothetical protein